MPLERKESVKYKGISFEVKERKVRGKDIFRFTGSSEEMDRGGDIIETAGWDLTQYKRNPVVLWNHNKSIPPIGRAVNVRRMHKEKQLVFDIEFPPKGVHPLADMVKGLVQKGFQKAVSVGYLPKDAEPIDEKDLPEHLKDHAGIPNRVKSSELVELSLTPIGQHQDALGSEDNISTVDNYIDELQLVTKSLKKWKHLHIDEKESSEDDERKNKKDSDEEIVDTDDTDSEESTEDNEEEKVEEELEEKGEDTSEEKEMDEDEAEDEEEDDEDEDKNKEKSIRYLEFDKDVFKSKEAVETWIKNNRYPLTKIKEGEFFYRVTQRPSEEFKVGSKFVSEEVAEGVHSSSGELKEPAELAAVIFSRSTKELAEEVTKSINLLRKEVGIMRKCFLEKMVEMADASYVADLQSFERSEKSEKTSGKSTAQERLLTDAVTKLMNTVTTGDNGK